MTMAAADSVRMTDFRRRLTVIRWIIFIRSWGERFVGRAEMTAFQQPPAAIGRREIARENFADSR
jgi:hypothetical protein